MKLKNTENFTKKEIIMSQIEQMMENTEADYKRRT